MLFPSWLVLLPLCILLSFTSYKTFRRAQQVSLAERKQAEADAAALARGYVADDNNNNNNNNNDDNNNKAGDESGASAAAAAAALTASSANNENRRQSEHEELGAAAAAASTSSRMELKDMTTGESIVDAGANNTDNHQNDENNDNSNNNNNNINNDNDLETYTDSLLLPLMDRSGTAAQKAELELMLQAEDHLAPWRKVLTLALVWLGYFIITLLLYRAHVVKACSGPWVVILLISVPYVCIVAYFWSMHLKKEHIKKQKVRYPFLPGDMHWTRRMLIKYPIYSFFAGVLAALTGVGGGLILSPIMLEMGMLPAVISATSNYLIVFTSSASAIQYIILGRIEVAEGLSGFATGLVGAVVGQKVVNHLLKKYKRQAFLIYLLAALTLISALCIVGVDIGEGFGSSSFHVAELCDGDG